MIDNENPNENPKNWTRQYVSSHRTECLLFLRELNVLAINYIEERRYWAAGGCIDLLLDGFDALQKIEKSDRIRSCIADGSCAAAELCALVNPALFENELRDMGIRPDFQGKSAARYLRDVAIMGFEDVQDYARSSELRNYAALMVRVLKSSISTERIRRDYAPNFPKNIQERLLKLDDDFFVPEIMQCAPNRCAVLDKKRLIFKRELVGNASSHVPANLGPVEMPADMSPDKAVVGGDSYFDGNTLQLIGYRIVSFLVCVVTLGIAFPWMLCMLQRWEAKHTVIHGRRLKFDGRGGQLFGRYLLWVLLTFITLGIYGIWLGLSVKKWTVKHTFYADDQQPVESYFSGGVGGYLGIHILAFLLTVFTLGIGGAWAKTMVLRWEAGHTHIGGSSLEFNGTGGQLFVKCLLLVVLIPLTLGIYALFFPVSYVKWLVKHTDVNGRSVDKEEQNVPETMAQEAMEPGSGDSKALFSILIIAVVAVVLAFQTNLVSFPDIGGLAKSIHTKFVSAPKQEEPPAASVSVLTDQELLELADEILNDDVNIYIANAGFLEADENDYITATDEWGYDDTFYRVIGYDTIAEAEEAAMELWYGTYSRRLSFDSSSHSMDMMRDQLMEHNGKLYRRYLGVGDGGYYDVVDYIVSRTDNEAVFSAHSGWADYDDDVSVIPFQFSMVLEDGTWKFWKYLDSQD